MAGKQLGPGSQLAQPDDDWSPQFVCERVCVSSKLMRKCGAKEATPGNCVTVCGLDAVDACTEACVRTVCVSASHVPAWNSACYKRCTEECVRGGTREPS